MEKIDGSALFTDLYDSGGEYPVGLSSRLRNLQSRVVRQLKIPAKGTTGKN